MEREVSLHKVQAEALIRQLRHDQQTRCTRLEQRTGEWIKHRLGEARHRALQRFHTAAKKERERFAREIAATEAAISAEARNRHQQHLAALVQAVIDRLPAALEKRWRTAAHRHEWIDAALADARRRLGSGDWRIRVAPIPAGESLAASEGDAQLSWEPDPELRAGLVIDKGGARLDASVAGLLADTTLLESQILTLLGEVRAGSSHDV